SSANGVGPIAVADPQIDAQTESAVETETQATGEAETASAEAETASAEAETASAEAEPVAAEAETTPSESDEAEMSAADQPVSDDGSTFLAELAKAMQATATAERARVAEDTDR